MQILQLIRNKDKKGTSKFPFKNKIDNYLVPEIIPFFSFTPLTFLYKVHLADVESNEKPATLDFESAIFVQPSTDEYFLAVLTAKIFP